MPFDPEPFRADTPAARLGRIHLNNAGAALMPRPVVEAIQGHIRAEAEMGGYEAADAAKYDVEAAYEHVARLIGAEARNIAIVENATVSFAQALAVFDFARGDTILTSRNDYISNQLMYLSLASRLGVEIVRAEDTPAGGVDLQSVRDRLRARRPRLVAMTWVPTNSGLVQPVEEIGAICQEMEIPYLVDACQAVGQIPVDVNRLHCDFLSATARKFLRGPRGVGFLYVSDRALQKGWHPLYVDMRGADWTLDDRLVLRDDARRFENWEFAYALVLGLGAAARYAVQTGVGPAGEYARKLAAHAREKLAALPRVRVLDHGAELCAIASVEVDDVNAQEVVARLREQAINTSATFREWAVLDMTAKQATSAVRISPHYYNTLREIDTAVAAIEEFVL
jgi:selenocysteine lyase/cysteine desulfurase